MTHMTQDATSPSVVARTLVGEIDRLDERLWDLLQDAASEPLEVALPGLHILRTALEEVADAGQSGPGRATTRRDPDLHRRANELVARAAILFRDSVELSRQEPCPYLRIAVAALEVAADALDVVVDDCQPITERAAVRSATPANTQQLDSAPAR